MRPAADIARGAAHDRAEFQRIASAARSQGVRVYRCAAAGGATVYLADGPGRTRAVVGLLQLDQAVAAAARDEGGAR